MFSLIQAVTRTDTAPLVRVPSVGSDRLSRALDAGAVGVVVPMVNSVEEARAAVAACRYQPRGTRSYGPARASLTLGADPTLIDRETLCFVQIETVAGAEHADEICAVAGLAGVVIGPGDLALSLGLEPSKWEDEPAHRAMRRTILVACLRAGIVPGTFTPSPQSAVRAVREGSRLVALSTDLGLMLEAARTGAAAVRSVASPLAADIATSD